MEIWKPIARTGGVLEVSDWGAVRRVRDGFVYKASIEPNGYVYLRRTENGKEVRPVVGVHAVVLETFVGPRPPDHDASHLNGVRSDNRLCNLRWETRQENNLRKSIHGTQACGEKNSQAKFVAADIVRIRRLAALVSSPQLAKEYGVCPTTIRAIWTRKTWKHISHNEGASTA